MPPAFWTDPLMYQGGSDSFLGPRDAIPLPQDDSFGLDLEAEIAVVTDDVPMGVDERAARSHIKLVMMVNDVTLIDGKRTGQGIRLLPVQALLGLFARGGDA